MQYNQLPFKKIKNTLFYRYHSFSHDINSLGVTTGLYYEKQYITIPIHNHFDPKHLIIYQQTINEHLK